MQKAVHISREIVDATVASVPSPGKRLLNPLKTFSLEHGVPVNVLEDVDVFNPPEIHQKEADLWMCILGEPTFIVGGTLINPKPQFRADGSVNEDELTGSDIEGGEEYVLRTGELLYIPAGVPHAHRAEGVARLYIIKIPSAS